MSEVGKGEETVSRKGEGAMAAFSPFLCESEGPARKSGEALNSGTNLGQRGKFELAAGQ